MLFSIIWGLNKKCHRNVKRKTIEHILEPRRHDRFIARKITFFQVVRYCLYDNWFETAINVYPIIGTYCDKNLTKF